LFPLRRWEHSHKRPGTLFKIARCPNAISTGVPRAPKARLDPQYTTLGRRRCGRLQKMRIGVGIVAVGGHIALATKPEWAPYVLNARCGSAMLSTGLVLKESKHCVKGLLGEPLADEKESDVTHG